MLATAGAFTFSLPRATSRVLCRLRPARAFREPPGRARTFAFGVVLPLAAQLTQRQRQRRAHSTAMASGTAGTSTVPSLDPARVALLKGHGVTLQAIEPMGAKVAGLDLKGPEPPAAVLEALQAEMANRGFLVVSGQGVLSGDEQVKASELWGGRQIHSTHGMHPKAPNKHIFRLSNDPQVGINGVGPQWHNDGSFEVGVFSHVGYHIVRVPENTGNTLFCHQGAAYDALPRETQEFWSRLVSVNATSGVLHPMAHDHPINGRRSVYLHLGMTGGVLEKVGEDEFRLLEEEELTKLFHSYNDLLNNGLPANGGNYAISYQYQEGDCIFIDNLALAHKASPQAHNPDIKEQGLRILHRTTVKAMKPFMPGFNLPATATRELLTAAQDTSNGKGVFVAGGLGFRWDESIRMQN
ncbi:unnamed protein product [Polarella glacialis]|uniref:TauD/TfdA-like domain-containing protein n=1 Tax=Polarella glacialis TaxID=89957 RepID=A0A813LQ33_POLGL|nr:unnamed protein product [Polarella glacialis]